MDEYTKASTPNYAGTTVVDDNRFFMSQISWGAVIAGALVALATYVTLATLGTAIGLGAYDPAEGDAVGRGTLIAAGIYALVSAILSMFAGGYVSGKLSGLTERTRLGLHGVSMWALNTVFALTAVAWGVGATFTTVAGVAGSTASTVAQASSGALANPNLNIDGVRAQIDGMQAQANSALNSPNATIAAEKSADVAAVSSWVAFFTLVVGAVSAVFGAMSAARVYSTAREPRTRGAYRTSSATAGV